MRNAVIIVNPRVVEHRDHERAGANDSVLTKAKPDVVKMKDLMSTTGGPFCYIYL